jgi:molybdenum cofactor biosynthesis enzyme MoaA
MAPTQTLSQTQTQTQPQPQAQTPTHTQTQEQTQTQAPTQTATQASPLHDTFGRFHDYLRISLTEKCNLRCTYGMPAEGVQLSARPQLATLTERKDLITIFAQLGVKKLRFTGGEPTISNQLTALIAHARDCGITQIGITSNGLLLRERLKELVDAGI